MTKIIKYYGGKGGMSEKILQYLPSGRKMYVEPFGGSATILLAQNTEIEIYNDLYKNVYSLFRVLSNKKMFERMKAKIDLMYYSEQIRGECKEKLQKRLSLVDRAVAFFYYNRTSFNGIGGFSANTTVRRGMSKSVSDFLAAVDGLEEYHKRLSNVLVLNKDAFDVMERYDSADTFFYLDPPYHQSTRTSTRYEVDFSDAQHDRLIDFCKQAKGKILLSGYDCEAYDRLGFEKESFTVNTVSGTHERKQKTETVWFNYKRESIKELF